MVGNRQRDSYRQILVLCRAVGDLVHVTQRERGGSSVYLASGGTRFRVELDALRRDTDRVIEVFLTLCNSEEGLALLGGDEGEAAKSMLMRLASVRTSVDYLRIDAGEAIEYLTDLNEALLILCGTLIESVDESQDRSSLLGLLALLRAKELAGTERAILAQVFAEDRFSDGSYLWVVALISAQETLFRIAVGGYDGAFAAELARIADSPSSRIANVLETSALVNGVSDLAVDPIDWFEAVTDRIDQLKTLEDSLFDNLLQQPTTPTDLEGRLISDAISATVLAMRKLRSQVDDVRHGELSLRDFLRGHGEGLVQAELQLATAMETEELATRVVRDGLTGVLNRSTVPSRIEAALQSSKANQDLVAVFMIDLDNFKVINDSLGHTVGDDLLYSVAQRLRSSVRSQDVVARVGGDEFLVVAPGLLDVQSVEELAAHILSYFKQPHDVSGRQLAVHISMGIGISRDAQDVDRLLLDADLALHRAKQTSRGGYVVFDNALRTEMEDRHAIEVGVRKALDTNKIHANFQPIVDLQTNEVVAAEALARWDRGDEVLVAGEFCGIAAEAGLLPRVDDMVRRSAFLNRPTFRGAQPKISINVGDLQLRQPYFAERMHEEMMSGGVAPTDVWVEVTEHYALTAGVAISNLERLRALGSTIALDDFGSGFSSLSVLRTLPIDVVKLDGFFVQNIHRDEATKTTVRSVLAILEALGLASVAEGVETSAELETLRSLGCDMAQGFYLSKPSQSADSWNIPGATAAITDLAA